MESVFLSYSFRDITRDFLGKIDEVLASHGIRSITGSNLGGEVLKPEVKRLIQGTDALVAILTPKAQLPDGQFQPSSWVQFELNHAREINKKTIAFKPANVRKLPGDYEYIEWDPQNHCPALLRLNSTLGRWKDSVGRRAKVRLFPKRIGRLLKKDPTAQVKYRLSRWSEVGEWIPVAPRTEVGASFVYLTGVWTDATIEVMIEVDGKRRSSPATPQWLHVELKEGA